MPTTYDRQLTVVQNAHRQLGNTLIAMQHAQSDGQAGNLESLSLDGAHQAEDLACKMRHLIYQRGELSRRQYLTGALPSTEVRFTFNRDNALLVLPPLLPDRRTAKSREYLSGLVYAALAEAAFADPLPQFERCVLGIVHCMVPMPGCRSVPDYDNIELKTVQDLLALYLMVDDSMRYGDAHRGVDIEIDRMAEVPESLIRQYDRIAESLLKISRRLQKQVQQILKDQRRGGRETGLLMGRRLLTRTLYHDDGRYFYKNRLPQDLPELAVALLVDESGSMSCADRITKARAASIIVYDFCKSLRIPVLVLGHTEIGRTVHIYSYAEFEARDANDCYRLMDMSARSDNRDGAALRYAAERLLRRPEGVKLLLTISDGQPCATGYYGTEAEADLRGIQREMTNRGVTLFAAAIGEDKDSIERIYGDGFLDIGNLDDLPVSLTRLIANRIRRR